MTDVVNVIPATSTQQQQQENRDGNNFTNKCLLTTEVTRDHHATCLLMTEDSTVLHKKDSTDIPNVVPNSVKNNIDMEIGLKPQEAGAMRARELNNHCDDLWETRLPNCSLFIRSSHALLLIATLLTTLTYQVPFHLFGTTPKQGYVDHNYKTGTDQDSILYRSFILLNSTTFIASVGFTMFLLQKFPLKPWTQISVSALFGSYMFAIKTISPNEVITLLFISIALLLLAVVGKLGGFARLSILRKTICSPFLKEGEQILPFYWCRRRWVPSKLIPSISKSVLVSLI